MVADVKGSVRKTSEREKALDFRGADFGFFRQLEMGCSASP